MQKETWEHFLQLPKLYYVVTLRVAEEGYKFEEPLYIFFIRENAIERLDELDLMRSNFYKVVKRKKKNSNVSRTDSLVPIIEERKEYEEKIKIEYPLLYKIIKKYKLPYRCNFNFRFQMIQTTNDEIDLIENF